MTLHSRRLPILHPINNDMITMLDDSPFGLRSIHCPNHPKERVTHVCTDFACQQSPLLCSICHNDPRRWSQHPHESAIKPLQEGIEGLSNVIRNQSKSIELVYERTIGHRDNQLLKFNLQKGRLLTQQVQNRLDSLQLQVEAEIERILKDFQSKIQQQRQELTRRIDEYRNQFLGNIEFIRRECAELLAYQNTLKYYNNPNTLTLKLIVESERKSSDWLLSQKRVLQKMGQILQNPSFVNTLMYTLNKCNKTNMLVLPAFRTQRRDVDLEQELRSWLRKSFNGWVELPQIVELQSVKVNQYMHSNKYLSSYSSNTH